MLGKRVKTCRGRWTALGLSLGLASGLLACRQASDRSCNFQSNGLKSDGWNGQDLADKELALIFLKGPSKQTSPIGSFLSGLDVKAAFFAQGATIEGNTSELQSLKDQGHLVGNSGYHYADLVQANHPVLELRTTDALITPYITGNQFVFYAPFKSFNEQMSALFRTNGLGKYVGPIKDDTLPSATFQYDEQCWSQELTVAACTQQYFDEIQRLGRGIVAFHDTESKTLELLNLLVPQLSVVGYNFVRLDQIPGVRTALARAGGELDLTGGSASCDDYD